MIFERFKAEAVVFLAYVAMYLIARGELQIAPNARVKYDVYLQGL